MARLLEEAGVFDGDGGLGGNAGDEPAVLLVVVTGDLMGHGEHADDRVLPAQRHRDEGANEIERRRLREAADGEAVGAGIGAIVADIVDGNGLAALDLLPQRTHGGEGEALADRGGRVLGERATGVGDDHRIALDGEDGATRIAGDRLQLIEHEAQKALEVERRGDGMGDLKQGGELARPLDDALFEQLLSGADVALGLITLDGNADSASDRGEGIDRQFREGLTGEDDHQADHVGIDDEGVAGHRDEAVATRALPVDAVESRIREHVVDDDGSARDILGKDGDAAELIVDAGVKASGGLELEYNHLAIEGPDARLDGIEVAHDRLGTALQRVAQR